MTKLKNIAAAATLTAVLMMGATSAQAGIMISDRAEGINQCEQAEEGFVDSIVTAISGLLMSDRSGLLVSDRSGLLVSDRSGLLVSDRAETSGCQQETNRAGLLISD